jgi:hypothetical protein
VSPWALGRLLAVFDFEQEIPATESDNPNQEAIAERGCYCNRDAGILPEGFSNGFRKHKDQ